MRQFILGNVVGSWAIIADARGIAVVIGRCRHAFTVNFKPWHWFRLRWSSPVNIYGRKTFFIEVGPFAYGRVI